MLHWGQLTWLVILQSHRILSGSASCSRTLTKTTLWFWSNGTLSQTTRTPSCTFLAAKSQFSADATVFLTPWSCPCWSSAWGVFTVVFCLSFKVSTAAFTCKITFRWLFSLALHPIQSLFFFLPLYSLSGAPPVRCDSTGFASQKPMRGRQSNPAQETSQPVIAGSQWSGRVLIFIHQTPRTT